MTKSLDEILSIFLTFCIFARKTPQFPCFYDRVSSVLSNISLQLNWSFLHGLPSLFTGHRSLDLWAFSMILKMQVILLYLWLCLWFKWLRRQFHLDTSPNWWSGSLINLTIGFSDTLHCFPWGLQPRCCDSTVYIMTMIPLVMGCRVGAFHGY